MFEQKEQFETWFQDNYFRLDTPSQFLGDEMNTVHFDWKKAYEEGTLEDHFRIALIDVNGTSYASCSPAVKLFYQELHEYDDSWIVERVFAPATKGDEAILKENEEDWEELVKLTAKMGDICREEGRTGEDAPQFLYNWTPLKIFPFTPFQWLASKVCREILPETVRARLEEMGVKLVLWI